METFGKISNFSDRAIGCFMGAAIGDAMGGPVECQHYKRIAREFPDFDSFLPYQKPPGLIEIGPGYALDAEPGNVTDDSYIRADLTRYLLANDPPYTATAFAHWLNAHADFRNWWKVAVEPLKRIEAGEIEAEDAGYHHQQGGGGGWWQPLGILYAGNPRRAASVTSDLCRIWKAPLERDILASAVAGQATAFREDATLDSIVDTILDASGPLATKLFQRAVEIAERATNPEHLYEELYAHCLVDRCSKEVDGPIPPRVTPKDDAEGFYSGILFAEQQPLALAYFVYGRGDPYRTILTAVKGGRDSDSIATNTASWLGALYGESIWPKSWLEQVQQANLDRLNLREMAEALIERARKIVP
jgi:ADP-ribosylglycohydrolase